MVVGEPRGVVKEVFEVVLKARQKIMDTIRPGLSCSEVSGVSMNILKKVARHRFHYSHGVGHSIGLGDHESPRVGEFSETILQRNMVITVEPMVYHDKFGAIRHSDTVLITKDGCMPLTTYDSGLIVV